MKRFSDRKFDPKLSVISSDGIDAKTNAFINGSVLKILYDNKVTTFADLAQI